MDNYAAWLEVLQLPSVALTTAALAAICLRWSFSMAWGFLRG